MSTKVVRYPPIITVHDRGGGFLYQWVPRLSVTIRKLPCITVVAGYRGKWYQPKRGVPKKALIILLFAARVKKPWMVDNICGHCGEQWIQIYRLRFVLDCMRNLFCLVVLKCIFMFKSVFVNPENFYCFVGRDRTRRGLVELIHISNGFGEIRVRTDAPREGYCWYVVLVVVTDFVEFCGYPLFLAVYCW